jgi:signal transduction histidine kinase/CheY-like chemotaxis protein
LLKIWDAPSFTSSTEAFLASSVASISCRAQPSRAFLRIEAARSPKQRTQETSNRETSAQASRARSRLLATASHDLRQPLQAIGLWVEMLSEQPLDSEVRAVLHRIQETSRGAERVLNTLLDTTQLDLGGVTVKVVDFAVADLLARVASTFGPLARERHLALRVGKSSAIARSDPVWLERILFNFISNAIRHSMRGDVLVGCRRRRGYLSFEVWDTGPGIPQERLENIFEEFVQLNPDGRDRARAGLGLGLSIAKRAASLLGHPLQVTSRVGKGSCFRVDVPIGMQTAAPSAAGADDCDAALFGAFVVVVEGEKKRRDAIESLLRHWGCHVVAAASAADAIRKLGAHLRLPNVLLVDCRRASDESGLQTIRAIRSVTAGDVPALLITRGSAKPGEAKIREPGVLPLPKRVPPEGLRKRLARALIDASSRLAFPKARTGIARSAGPNGAPRLSPGYAS